MNRLPYDVYTDPLDDDEVRQLVRLAYMERHGFDALDGYDHSQLMRALMQLASLRGISIAGKDE